jgi:hypothetical protein
MSRMKVIAVAMVVVGAFSSVMAVSASARMGWFVNGTKLAIGAKAALKTKAVVDEEVTFNAPALTLKIKCKGLTAAGAAIREETLEAMGEASEHTFEGCTELSPANCELVETSIATEAILILPILVLSIPSHIRHLGLILHPKTGARFATIGLEGSKCGLAGEKPITGHILANAPHGLSEEKAQLIEGLGSTEGNNSLEVAGNKAFIEGGKALLELESGSKWSFRE